MDVHVMAQELATAYPQSTKCECTRICCVRCDNTGTRTVDRVDLLRLGPHGEPSGPLWNLWCKWGYILYYTGRWSTDVHMHRVIEGPLWQDNVACTMIEVIYYEHMCRKEKEDGKANQT